MDEEGRVISDIAFELDDDEHVFLEHAAWMVAHHHRRDIRRAMAYWKHYGRVWRAFVIAFWAARPLRKTITVAFASFIIAASSCST